MPGSRRPATGVHGASLAVRVGKGAHVVVVARASLGQSAGVRAVVPLVLQKDPAARRQVIRSRVKDAPVRVQTVGAAVEREVRLVLGDVAPHAGDVLRGM